MAEKNIKTETEVISPENVTINNKWLYNPVAYSQMSGDFTMLQQRILAGILEKMQEKVLRSINDKKEGQLFPSLFSEEEMRGTATEIDIDASYFGITPEHYPYLEEALKDLANIRIGFPKAEKDKLNYVIAPLFARLEIPMGEKRRMGKVKVVMLNKNLQDFFSMDKGYTEYLARITRISKKVRTPRIYIFLSSFQDRGHKKVLYEDFCRFLGIDDETARADRLNKINQLLKDGKITKREANVRLEALAKWENPFKKFNKVKSQILEPAKIELDTFSDNDEIDITFMYEPLYENVSKRGNPSHILFTIIKKRLALEHDRDQAFKRQRHTLVSTLCDRYRDIKAFDLRDAIKDVDIADFDDFKSFCYTDIARAVEKNQPDIVGAYVLTMIDNWIAERKKKNVEIDQSESLFDDDPLTDADRRQKICEHCYEELREMGLTGADVWFSQYHAPSKTVVFAFDADAEQRLKSAEIYGRFMDIVHRHFGKVNVKLRKAGS